MGTPSVDKGGEQPVVLVGFKDVAHLVSTNGVQVFIIATDFFPLSQAGRRQTHAKSEKERVIRPKEAIQERVPELWRVFKSPPVSLFHLTKELI